MKILRFAEIKLQVVLFSNKKIYIHTHCVRNYNNTNIAYIYTRNVFYTNLLSDNFFAMRHTL